MTGEAERRRFMGQRPKPDAKFCRNETEKAVAYENAGLIARRCGRIAACAWALGHWQRGERMAERGRGGAGCTRPPSHPTHACGS